MTNGIYKHEHFQHYAECDLFVGDILIDVKETEKSYVLTLIGNTVKYDAPQIDDMFRDKTRVIIKKGSSEHVLRDWGDDSFTLYPYRVGVPYLFEKAEIVHCKDCKYLEISGCYGECSKELKIVQPLDFCSKGERN